MPLQQLPSAILRPLKTIVRTVCASAPYDPVSYWSERKNPNNDEGSMLSVKDSHVNYIRSHVAPAGRFLEFGPGVGRTFSAYPDNATVDTVDISDRYLTELRSFAAVCRVQIGESLVIDPFDPLPFSDSTYAVAVACQVFLHMPPQQLAFVAAELLRVARKTVVISSYTPACQKQLRASHCFSHDYLDVVSRVGGKLGDCYVNNGSIFFTMRRAERGDYAN